MRLKTAIVALLFASSAHAFTLRGGSWGYEYPTDWSLKGDGQSVVLTGGRGFTFHGVITDYWIDVNRCQAGQADGPCLPNGIHINWYSGLAAIGPPIVYKGIGMWGVATLDGATIMVDAAHPKSKLGLYTYGDMTMPPLGVNGQHKVKTGTYPLYGRFAYGNAPTVSITGHVVVTVDFEQENGKWVIEGVDYDVVN